MLNVIMLNVVMLNVIMLNVVMLNVLGVVGPNKARTFFFMGTALV
jgi:hypothetical protein